MLALAPALGMLGRCGDGVLFGLAENSQHREEQRGRL